MKKTLTIIQTIALATVVVGGCSDMKAAKRANVDTAVYTVDGNGPTQDLIRRCKAAVDKNPDKPDLHNKLGLALMQFGRETGELDWYERGRASFEKALSLNPKDSATLANVGWASTIFHDFDTAIEYANKAIALDPQRAQAYGVLADSQLDGGQYDEATKNIQKMMDLKPDLAAFSRAAQLRLVKGDTKGAVYMLLKAIQAGGPLPETTAWVRTQLADIYWGMGAIPAAEAGYKNILKAMPEYRHAIAGLARVNAAMGKYGEAAALYERATKGLPPIPYVVAMGDVYAKLGRNADAERAYARVEEIVKEHKAHGIEGDDIQLSLFYADHDRNKAEALAMMAEAVQKHSSVPDYTAFAWASHKAGKHADAVSGIRKALGQNTQDALLYYRAARIFAHAGNKQESKKWALAAVSLNPKFHVIYAEDALRLTR